MIFMIVLICIVLSAFALWAFLFWRSQHERKWVYSAMQELSVKLGLKDTEMQRLPAPAVSGTYCSYPVIIEWAKTGDGKKYRWLFSATLSRPARERFFVQSDRVEGRLRKVIDLNLCESGDEAFDRFCLVFSSSAGSAGRVFGPYIRSRLMNVLEDDFSIGVNHDHATLEIVSEKTASMPYLASVCSVWIELVNLIESV